MEDIVTAFAVAKARKIRYCKYEDCSVTSRLHIVLKKYIYLCYIMCFDCFLYVV